jgi:hypothetical protein
MPQRDQRVHQLGRRVRCLRPQQAHAQAHRRQAVLFRGAQARIDRIDHLGQAVVPGRPVGRIHDHVGVARAAVGQPLGVTVGELGQTLPGRRQSASPVEEVQKVRQALELEQALAGPRQGRAGLPRPSLQGIGLEATFEVGMDLGLGQGAQSVERQGGHPRCGSRSW